MLLLCPLFTMELPQGLLLLPMPFDVFHVLNGLFHIFRMVFWTVASSFSSSSILILIAASFSSFLLSVPFHPLFVLSDPISGLVFWFQEMRPRRAKEERILQTKGWECRRRRKCPGAFEEKNSAQEQRGGKKSVWHRAGRKMWDLCNRAPLIQLTKFPSRVP